MEPWPPSAEAVLPRRAPIGAEAMASFDALVLLTVGKSAMLFSDAVLVILEKESLRVDRLVADAVLVIPPGLVRRSRALGESAVLSGDAVLVILGRAAMVVDRRFGGG